jgi:hypothetical protein
VRQIEPADERDRIVDDHDLLMMRRADRMFVIQPEVESAMRPPVELVHRQPFAIHCEHHRVIPREHVHPQVALALHDGVQKCAELLGPSVVRAAGHEADAAVDVPAEYENTALGAGNRRSYRGEIGFAVDEERETVRSFDAPAVAARHEQSPLGLVLRCGEIHGIRLAGPQFAARKAAGGDGKPCAYAGA